MSIFNESLDKKGYTDRLNFCFKHFRKFRGNACPSCMLDKEMERQRKIIKNQNE